MLQPLDKALPNLYHSEMGDNFLEHRLKQLASDYFDDCKAPATSRELIIEDFMAGALAATQGLAADLVIAKDALRKIYDDADLYYELRARQVALEALQKLGYTLQK